jgi:hypothetical protein
MYETHDVLAEVLKQARADLDDENTKRLPSAPPQYGSLDVKNDSKRRLCVCLSLYTTRRGSRYEIVC